MAHRQLFKLLQQILESMMLAGNVSLRIVLAKIFEDFSDMLLSDMIKMITGLLEQYTQEAEVLAHRSTNEQLMHALPQPCPRTRAQRSAAPTVRLNVASPEPAARTSRGGRGGIRARSLSGGWKRADAASKPIAVLRRTLSTSTC